MLKWSRRTPEPADRSRVPDDERRAGADRRDDEKRRRIEVILDRGFRPGKWAARAAYALGLQGGPSVHVDEHDITLSRPPRGSLRVAFASDFHSGASTDDRILADACAKLEALRPDILLLGGDFVSVRANDIHVLATMLARIHPPFGKFGVFGNHDLKANWRVVRDALSSAGVRMLVNEVVQLQAPHDDVSVIGLDDPFMGDPDGEVLDAAPDVRLLLMHAPDCLFAVGNRRFDVALCGHTHGGQIVLPGGVIPYLPHGDLNREFPAGLFRIGPERDRTLLVSRGVGCSTAPVRIGCAAEIHLMTIAGR